jgi:hypothetical protein
MMAKNIKNGSSIANSTAAMPQRFGAGARRVLAIGGRPDLRSAVRVNRHGPSPII